MIINTDHRRYKLIVTRLLKHTIFTFDNGHVYFLNHAGLHISNLDDNITLIGRPDPQLDSLKGIFLPGDMTFDEWVYECRIMEQVSEELGIKNYPRNATKITLKKIARRTH